MRAQLAAPFKLALTGTPMENNLMELWSLLSITAPGLFPNPSGSTSTTRGRSNGRRRRTAGPAAPPDQAAVKRRTKEQVAAELPAKQEQVLEVELHPRHRRVYQTYLHRERQKVLGLLDDLDRNRFAILRSLTLLRQLPARRPGRRGARGVPCAKLDALVEQLERRGRRRAPGAGLQPVHPVPADRAQPGSTRPGSSTATSTARRRPPAVISSFKSGTAPVFLISLKAGGFGLNLTEADYCFLLDPWWNPATEAQAVDRTHRIGQTRNVMVYRLIAKDTIEEKVMALKARKAELFSSVIDSDGEFSSALSADDIRALFA